MRHERKSINITNVSYTIRMVITMERNVTFSVGMPMNMVDELEQLIDGKTHTSRNSVIKTAVKEFLEKEKTKK